MTDNPRRQYHQALPGKAFSNLNSPHSIKNKKKIHVFPGIFYGNGKHFVLDCLVRGSVAPRYFGIRMLPVGDAGQP